MLIFSFRTRERDSPNSSKWTIFTYNCAWPCFCSHFRSPVFNSLSKSKFQFLSCPRKTSLQIRESNLSLYMSLCMASEGLLHRRNGICRSRWFTLGLLQADITELISDLLTSTCTESHQHHSSCVLDNSERNKC